MNDAERRIYARLSKFTVLPPVVLDFNQSEKPEIVANVKKYLQFLHLEDYAKMDLEAYTSLTFEFYTTFKFAKNGTDVVCLLGDKRRTIDATLMHQIFGFVSTEVEAPPKGFNVENVWLEITDCPKPKGDMQSRFIKDLAVGAEDTDLRGMVKEIAARMESLMVSQYDTLKERLDSIESTLSQKALQDELLKQNEALGSEVATLRCDLQQVQDEVATYKEWIRKSIPELSYNWQTKATDLENRGGIVRIIIEAKFSSSIRLAINIGGQKLSFTFDKVFMPDASQEDVFVEISQLVQSALDGYKVCIFAYGQTGSGKTHTMMGKPGLPDQKGLIPRSLEQVFETRQIRQAQGWKYDMRVSMLEIYNETIRDLLAPNRTCSDASRAENAGKQYAIKHDANGNTQVSDLTIVDVQSSKEVSYLLERAAQSR
ncbi:Kinesin-2 [Striga hermonthica]|uniref:Kinesin-2 n=1 Tax=Striga hermonthica TaxID=68872 RepID=A0A9N7MY84_STRHE|nr:Kinesin-2 [Striga hermonthica]